MGQNCGCVTEDENQEVVCGVSTYQPTSVPTINYLSECSVLKLKCLDHLKIIKTT